MAQIIQVKRTTKEVGAAADYAALTNQAGDTLAAGELLWGSAANTNTGTGVLYIGQGTNTMIPIGGKAYTDMLDPDTDTDSSTKLVSSAANGNGAQLILSDGQSGVDQNTVTLKAPAITTADFTLNLPDAQGAVAAGTLLSLDSTGKIDGNLVAGGSIQGTSYKVGSDTVVDGSRNIVGNSLNVGTGGVTAGDAALSGSITSVDDVVASGDISGNSLDIGGGDAVITSAGAITGASVDVSGAASAASFTADSGGNISTSGGGNISTAGGSISSAGAIAGTSIDVDSGDIGAVGVTQAGAVSGVTSLTASGKITAGEIEVGGQVVQTNTADIVIQDSMLQLADGADPTSETNDVGWFGSVHDGTGTTTNQAGMVWDQSADKFKIFSDAGNADLTSATALDGSETTATLIGNVDGNVTGNVTGNADTATALATSRTIGMTGDVVWTSAGFDGSDNVTGTATIQDDSITADMIANSGSDMVELKDLGGVDAYGSAGTVLTVSSTGTLEWTSKTAAGQGGGSLYGIAAVVDREGTAGEINVELTDGDAGNNDRITLKEGNNVDLSLDTSVGGDEKISIGISDSTIESKVTTSVVNALSGVDVDLVSGFTVGVNVPATADFHNSNTLSVASISASEAVLQLSDDSGLAGAKAATSVTLEAGTNVTLSDSSGKVKIDATYDQNEVEALITTGYIEGKFSGDELTDWATSGAGVIHSTNYVDNDTTYNSTGAIDETNDTFSLTAVANGGIIGHDQSTGIRLNLGHNSITGSLADGNIASATDWNGAVSDITAALAIAGGSDAGKLVQWGVSGNLQTAGTIQSGKFTVGANGINSTQDLLLDSDSDAIVLDAGGPTITFDNDKLTASGDGVELENFILDAGVI